MHDDRRGMAATHDHIPVTDPGWRPVAAQNEVIADMDNNEAQEYVDQFARDAGVWPKPGNVPDFHKIMAFHDIRVLKAQQALGEATYAAERTLDPVTKELIFLAMFTVMRSNREQLTAHVRMALDLGISSQQILETLEMALPVAGIVAFLAGFEAWREVTDAPGLEPSAERRDP